MNKGNMTLFGDDSSAVLSECRTYRYELWRRWNKELPYCVFIGLNPSTADETVDDPTINRCKKFAADWGYGGLCMVNLFAFRATDPPDMKQAIDPVGPDNNKYLMKAVKDAGVVIAAWGTDGGFHGRDEEIIELIDNLSCLSITRGGFPGHPLYLKANLKPKPFNP